MSSIFKATPAEL